MDIQKEFIKACKVGDFDTIKSLLDNENVNPVYYSNWAIRLASRNGHYNVVKLLLEDNRVNPADLNNFAIQWASAYGHYNVVKLLLKDNRVINFFKISDDNNWAIKGASLNGHYNVVKLLLRENRIINSFNIDNINYIKNNCSKTIINFYKKYFNLYHIIDIFLFINIICDTTIKLSINYLLPKQLKDFILHHYVYLYRQNL